MTNVIYRGIYIPSNLSVGDSPPAIILTREANGLALWDYGEQEVRCIEHRWFWSESEAIETAVALAIQKRKEFQETYNGV